MPIYLFKKNILFLFIFILFVLEQDVERNITSNGPFSLGGIYPHCTPEKLYCHICKFI